MLDDNLATLLYKQDNIGEHSLKLAKTMLLKKNLSADLKDLIGITYLEFNQSLENIQKFWLQKKKNSVEDIKKVIPEILQVLSSKLKEWYNIDAPEYTSST